MNENSQVEEGSNMTIKNVKSKSSIQIQDDASEENSEETKKDGQGGNNSEANNVNNRLRIEPNIEEVKGEVGGTNSPLSFGDASHSGNVSGANSRGVSGSSRGNNFAAIEAEEEKRYQIRGPCENQEGQGIAFLSQQKE